MSELKIVTIGAWGHLGRVLHELDRAGEHTLAGMAAVVEDDEPQKYQRLHPCAGNAPIFTDYRKMLDELRPDVAIVSTRIDRIATLALECAGRACHLITEKPLAIDHTSLKTLWDACITNRIQCIAILNNCAHPVIIAAGQIVQQNRLGKIALVNTQKSYKWGDRPEWFGRRAIYGGTIPWVGIHALDFIYSITGQTFGTVAAMQSNVAHPERVECEDNCVLALTLSGGGHATASLDLLRPAAAESHGDDVFRVVGERGTLEGNLTRNTCALTTAAQSRHELPLPPPAPYFTKFLDSIRNQSVGGAASPEMVRAFMLTHASLCARDAADSGQIVRIEPRYAGR